jgi:hypothetical protein
LKSGGASGALQTIKSLIFRGSQKIDLRYALVQRFDLPIMIYLILGAIILASLLFLALPFLKGPVDTGYFKESDRLHDANLNKEQNIKDKIESTKLALRDLDMENKIGKIANEDFDLLKNELLDEWKSAEDEFSTLKKSQNKSE